MGKILNIFKNIGIRNLISIIIITSVSLYLVWIYKEKQMLLTVIERLSADSRVAEVVVSKVENGLTTIKFLEYDTDLEPLEPQFYTFSGNIIQFQAMVIRFDDYYVQKAHPLKGKSAYIFMKVFRLTDKGAEVYEINQINDVPSGYEADEKKRIFERMLWRKFWDYALDSHQAEKAGVKNAQIEAPGTKFVPGLLYTLKIEHDGGLRIDNQRIPSILKGEKIN
ncbi:MAG: hypothetical protein ABIH19_03275 [Candidatus Omnitrophota bacterium]